MDVGACDDHYQHENLLVAAASILTALFEVNNTRVPSSHLLSCDTTHGLARGEGKRAFIPISGV